MSCGDYSLFGPVGDPDYRASLDVARRCLMQMVLHAIFADSIHTSRGHGVIRLGLLGRRLVLHNVLRDRSPPDALVCCCDEPDR